jgi:hypothetical protein
MFRILHDMPPGTVGVEAVGDVTEEDYRTVLAPVIEEALRRQDVGLLYVLGGESDSYSAGAAWKDTKLWAKHLKGWERVALVSDADWLENAVKAFGWLLPGEVKVFETDDVPEAKAWLVGIDLDDDDD